MPDDAAAEILKSGSGYLEYGVPGKEGEPSEKRVATATVEVHDGFDGLPQEFVQRFVAGFLFCLTLRQRSRGRTLTIG